MARRDASMRQARRAVDVSIAGGILTLVVALGFTALIVRSINAPLRRLGRSMAAITRGDLDATIPPPGRDEIGAMARALVMLRDSLIERDRLERERQRAEAEIRAARDAAEAALGELRAAQANLVQAEKMASFGQLTAGIAHEIKNPLNFVNNFASLSVELLDELKAAAAPALAGLGDDTRAEIDETIDMLTGNLEKIAEHGRRADSIVRSMLEHSRGASGERREVDLNALVEEALNLAYHGARAQDQHFNITLERDFDQAIAPDRAGAAGRHAGLPQPDRQRLLCRNQAPARGGRREVQAGAEGDDARSGRRGRDRGCATTALASRPRSRTSCSSRSSRPSRPAKAPGLASRSATTS